MIDNKYTMPGPMAYNFGHGLSVGDIYIICPNGDMVLLVGCYCMWPKQEPRVFVVTHTPAKDKVSAAADKAWAKLKFNSEY